MLKTTNQRIPGCGRAKRDGAIINRVTDENNKISNNGSKGKTTSQCYKYLKQISDSVETHGIQVKMVAIKGHPHETIIKFAEANQMDLIVMCTRGHSGFSRWLMGGIADRVVRRVNVPVPLGRARREETRE